MPKKKRKSAKKKRPVPPRPSAAGGGGGNRAPGQPETSARDERRAAAKDRRAADMRRRRAQQRRARIRTLAIVLVVAAAIAGFLVYRAIQGREEARRFSAITSAAGCGNVEETDAPDARGHLQPGETVEYTTSPPSIGKHAASPLRSGVYNEPFSTDPNAQPSIYQAVHSLEHGYVIIWYRELSPEQLSELEKAFGTERKVILVPYPTMPADKGNVALTAWGRLQYCRQPNVRAIEAFVDRYREKTAPEPTAQ